MWGLMDLLVNIDAFTNNNNDNDSKDFLSSYSMLTLIYYL